MPIKNFSTNIGTDRTRGLLGRCFMKQVKIQQVFLSYAYDTLEKKTLFEKLGASKFKSLPMLER